MRRGFLDRLCCFFALLGSFGLQVFTLFLFVKRLFLAVVFSYSDSPQHPKIQALLS
ncbi:hypothetical protein HMPREF1451_00561 [Helicobacter pylori HP260BFii]|uniref:Uncharacterized protein n=1 Tax=Helicobacter pylori GAM260BSi TaxID=1159046 RepID=M3PFB1_HELPX|nr:hypothetical protein HMPREF1418_00802 [Helicobacter pylori GAM260BSi]EMH68761.1 hypothetical protein HMPREF1451_00561 [Helicobacter pylori HP260BFii]